MSVNQNEFNYFGTQLSALCSKIATPVILTGLFRDLLARHFVDPNNIREVAIRHMIWSDQDSSKLQIESIHRWKPETTQARPAIILKRNAYRNTRLSIAEERQGSLGDLEGNTRYITAWAGSHTLFCLAKEGAQAELLSTEVQQGLTEFAPVIIRSLPHLHRFQVAEIGAVSMIEESEQTFAVPVTVSYQYEQTWILRQQAPRLMRLDTGLIYDC